jgi:hypothetical protein
LFTAALLQLDCIVHCATDMISFWSTCAGLIPSLSEDRDDVGIEPVLKSRIVVNTTNKTIYFPWDAGSIQCVYPVPH